MSGRFDWCAQDRCSACPGGARRRDGTELKCSCECHRRGAPAEAAAEDNDNDNDNEE